MRQRDAGSSRRAPRCMVMMRCLRRAVSGLGRYGRPPGITVRVRAVTRWASIPQSEWRRHTAPSSNATARAGVSTPTGWRTKGTKGCPPLHASCRPPAGWRDAGNSKGTVQGWLRLVLDPSELLASKHAVSAPRGKGAGEGGHRGDGDEGGDAVLDTFTTTSLRLGGLPFLRVEAIEATCLPAITPGPCLHY